MRNLPRLLTSSLAAAALLAACGGGSSTDGTTAPAAPKITVSGQWARTSPSATMMGAAYMTIESTADDELIGAKVDGTVAMKAEIHEMVVADGEGAMTDDSMMGGMSDTTMPGGGNMTMQKVDKIAITPGTAIELKPGGYHVMLMGLATPLETGTSFMLTLTFTRAGDVTVEVPVREDAPE